MKIPKQLRKLDFRFFKVSSNGKIPIEKKWNTENCYPYNSIEILKHTGNYGVVCGIGKLIVIDFDEIIYFYKIRDKFPDTFKVKTAKKKMLHYYYILEDEMFKKISIRDKNDNTLADIQALGSGVVAPGSKIDKNSYEVVNDVPIAKITISKLKEIFKDDFKIKEDKKVNLKNKISVNGQVLVSDILAYLGIGYNEKLSKCPFHDMHGKGNLSFDDDKGIWHCFHCGRSGNIFQLLMEVKNINFKDAKSEIKILWRIKNGIKTN